MAQNVADLLWDLLYQAGVRRCYGIVGDALNPILDALPRNGKIDFIHVRHEEYGGFAASKWPQLRAATKHVLWVAALAATLVAWQQTGLSP